DIASYTQVNAAEAGNAVNNFMSHLGDVVRVDAIEAASHVMLTLTGAPLNNTILHGVVGIFDNISSTQYNGFSAGFKAELSSLGITMGTFANNTLNGSAGVDRIYGLGGDDKLN